MTGKLIALNLGHLLAFHQAWIEGVSASPVKSP
jgi:hypothetical protein